MKNLVKHLEKIAGIKLEKKDGKLYYSGSLYLEGTQITSLPDNLTVGGYLYLEGTQITSLPENLTVGGSLDLEGTQITSLPENLTVGGSLDLEGTQITSLPDNLTVGGSLYLRGTQITSLPENLTVGGYLDLRGTQITEEQQQKVNREITNYLLKWQDGKYIKVDGMFCEVISHRNNVYKVKNIGESNPYFIVGEGRFFAHGETLKKANEDLQFKIISEKLKSEPILADTVIDIKYYRLLTGACEFGVNQWIKENKIKQTSFKASELLPLLQKTNAYGLEKFKSLLTFNK